MKVARRRMMSVSRDSIVGACALLAGACAQLGACTRSRVWIVDDLARVGGHATEVMGAPKAIDTERGRAVCFDGTRDGLVVGANPIAGLAAFTVEVLFRPDMSSAPAARVVHIAEDDSEDRALIETRTSTADRWFLDTFLKAGTDKLTLAQSHAEHAAGTWYWVALTYGDQQMRHYVNGALEASGAVAFRSLARGHTSLGMRMNHVSWFKGCVRELRISPVALPPERLQ